MPDEQSQRFYNGNMLIEGIFAAVPTPFYSDERVYLRKLEANMAHYSRTLLSGMLVMGSTGETALLDSTEFCDVLRVAAEAAAPEKVLIAGTGRESVKATVELSAMAAMFGYDAVLVRPPTYYSGQMTPAAILHYFRCVADRSPLPVILYNIPQCVPYDIPVEVIGELAQHPNIIGIKDSSGNVERITATVEATKNAPRRGIPVTPIFQAVTSRMQSTKYESNASFVSTSVLSGGTAMATMPKVISIRTRIKEVGFQVLCGASGKMLESLEAGAVGAILGMAAFAPQACLDVYLAWKDHDLQLAEENQLRIQAAGQRIVAEMGVSGVKYACDFNGYYGGRARLPLLPIGADEKAEVEKLLAGIRG